MTSVPAEAHSNIEAATKLLNEETVRKVWESFTEADLKSMFEAIEPFFYKTNAKGKFYLIPYSMKKDIEKDVEINVFIKTLMYDGRADWGVPVSRRQHRAANMKRNKVKKLW